MLVLLLALGAPLGAFAGDDPFPEIDEALASRQLSKAGDALVALLEDEAQAEQHPGAWLRVGDLAQTTKRPYAALIAYAHAWQGDPEAAAPKLKLMLESARQVHDDLLIEALFAEDLPGEHDGRTEDEAALLGARSLLRRGEYDAAIARLEVIGSGSHVLSEAHALRGVALVQKGEHGTAMGSFLAAEATSLHNDPEHDALISLNLGRTYYGAGNFLKSIEYFGAVPRESHLWPEAQFERAWAHFRIDDYVGTLSVLRTWQTGFFEDHYTPELDLLRLYALFLLCKFPSAGTEIETFIAKYEPMKQILDTQLLTLTPESAWGETIGWADGLEPKLPAALLEPLRWEDRFQDARESVRAAEAEVDRLEKDGSSLARFVATEVDARRDAIALAEGARVVARAQAARDELKERLDAIQITKLDIMSYETAMYERAAASGELDYGDRFGQLRKKLRKSRFERAWPYEGESWADELGYYRVETRSDCAEDQPGGSGR